MAETDIQAIYTTALQNTRALEQQGLKQIEHQLSGLGQYLKYRSALEAQKQIGAKHVERLDKALDAVGASMSGLKEGVMSVAGKIGAAVHATASDETLKNLYAGYAYQFDKVAAHKSLAVIAEAAGHGDAASTFRTSMEEDRASADVIDGLIESVTRDYLKLATSGRKADS